MTTSAMPYPSSDFQPPSLAPTLQQPRKALGEPDAAGVTGNHSIWWEWTAGISGTVEMDTVGSSFDTVLAVYTGSTVTNLVPITSNDDMPNGGGVSQVTFTALAGATYRIKVDGFEDATGIVQLNVVMTPPPPLFLGQIQIINGHLTFQIHGTQTQFFQLQTSTNLVSWETILTNQLATSVIDFTQSMNVNSPMRFYRAIPWP